MATSAAGLPPAGSTRPAPRPGARVGTEEFHSAALPVPQEAAILYSANLGEAAANLLKHEIKDPVGRNNIAICTNISCWLNGGEDIVRHCERRLGIKLGESTADGRVYLKPEEECLAACAGAPMMVVNGHYHENLTTETVDRILDELK